MAISPHFSLPFRFLSGSSSTGSGIAAAEQDSFADIANCVECICRTPQGSRIDNLDFGFPNVELTSQPVLSQDLIDSVIQQEPRAVLLFYEDPDALDVMIDRITVEIRGS
jgi:phage baseplate assembly protein W